MKTRKSYTTTLFLILSLVVSMATAGLSAAEGEKTWRAINVKNAPIEELVAQVAEITGKTFVVDPRLKGNVTVISSSRMDANSIYALFLSVLRVHNFTATESGGVIRIQQNNTGKQTPGAQGDLSSVSPEELVTRVISAQNVESTELVKILRPLIPQYGHIAAVSRPNVVIISDHADNIIRLMKLIRKIDVSDEDEIVMVDLKDAWVGTVVALLERVAPEEIGRNAKGPQRVQIIANERNNSLVIRGKPRPIAQVLKLVEKLDKPATATGSTQVIYLRHADSLKVAEILNGILSGRQSTEEGQTQQTSIQADESLNAVVARADPGTMNEILDIIEKLDVRRTQIAIEAAIVEVSDSFEESLGVEMAVVDGRAETVPLISTSVNGAIAALLGGIIDADGGIDPLAGIASQTSPVLAAARIDANGISFGAVVNALATNTNANLLSAPTLLTLDNEEAKIIVGQEVPFRTGSFTTNTDGASNPFTTIQREDVGLELTVTPHVHDGTAVRLEILAKIEEILPSAIGAGGFSDVVTNKREISTMVLANDGQTIVLGGLIRDNITNVQKKVPLLGSIPFLGRLFRSDSDTHNKLNLLIFLRPTILKTKEDTQKITNRKYTGIWETEILSTNYEADIQAEIDGLYEGKH